MGRDVPFDPSDVCDRCGAVGAYDFMGDRLCPTCCEPKEPGVAETPRWGFVAAVSDIITERRRQMVEEGWSPAHDDLHDNGEMARAAGCYALHAGQSGPAQVRPGYAPQDWPWDTQWWKPKDQRRDLIKAGALIVAEIERLDRLTEKR